MTPQKEAEKQIRAWSVPGTRAADEHIIKDALTAFDKTTNEHKVELGPLIWRHIVENNKTRWASAATIVLVIVLSIAFFNKAVSPVWAMEQTIEALKEYRGAYLAGLVPGEKGALVGFEMWIRTSDTGISSTDALITLDDGAMQWTRDNSTYSYSPSINTVEYEDALTFGISHWFGPKLFKMLSHIKNIKTTFATDPATGREVAILSGSHTDALGPKSLQVEFDVETELPVSLKHWNNLQKKGSPTFSAMQIRYFEQLDDSVFVVQVPEGARYVEKPITIPEVNIEIMSHPSRGISAQGLTKGEASRVIIDRFLTAAIEGNLKVIKTLVPVCADWSDKTLRNMMSFGRDDGIVEVINIGEISKISATRLGPIVVVPVTTKHLDQTIWLDKFIIQFRQMGTAPSCVIHGTYGLPVQLE